MDHTIPWEVDVLILGGGPAGLEAALAASEHEYSIALFEAGQIGESVWSWGHVRLFSPWSLNYSPRARAQLEQRGVDLPDPDAHPTGWDLVSKFLLPLAKTLPASVAVHPGITAIAATRVNTLKGDHIGAPERADAPFRVLWRNRQGREGTTDCRVLVDATGVYETPAGLGSGGISTPGEGRCGRLVVRHLTDILGAERQHYRGVHTLLVGSGYSAGTAARDLAQLVTEEPGTRVTWAVRRTDAAVLDEIPGDPLPERRALTDVVNRLAATPPQGFEILRGAAVEAVALHQNHRDAAPLIVKVRAGAAQRILEVDRILGLTGYRPQMELLRELQVHTCYASEGLMNLAAALLATSRKGGDCLAMPAGDVKTLISPEPNLFVIGSKSYGRNSHYLLRSGWEQVDVVFRDILPRTFGVRRRRER